MGSNRRLDAKERLVDREYKATHTQEQTNGSERRGKSGAGVSPLVQQMLLRMGLAAKSK